MDRGNHPENPAIAEQLKRLPHRPGVYIYRDAARNVIYVGKAKNLSHRVRSYFQSPAKLNEKTRHLVSRIADIDFFIASSEKEALIMELNFIKQYRPHYNIMLKDDKTFPYLKIDVREKWPRIYVTRRYEQDGGRYFGPFSGQGSVKQTVRLIKRLFPIRFCSKDITKTHRPCLEYHLGHCLAPCTGDVKPEEYRQVIDEVILFLEGKRDSVIKELHKKMERASEAMDYENAARIRDQIQSMQEVIEGEQAAAIIRGEEDVIAFVQEGDRAYVQVLFVRGNKLTGREGFLIQGTQHEEQLQIMTAFVKQYYSSSPQIPPLLMLQYPVEDREVIREWLKGKRGGAVDIMVPQRGLKKELVDMAAENARQGYEQIKIKEITSGKTADDAIAELEEALKLPAPPDRMEAYDISNIQGTSAVGSMVVFEKGLPKSAHYRRFKIKTVEGANDYAMLQEVLRRRFKHSDAGDKQVKDAWSLIPDLVLIDGGKGQLNAAREVLDELKVTVPLASLAKENEEVFLPKRPKPVVLPKSSPGLQLLQRLRDEAHRFAISYFSNLHRKKSFASAMDGIPGIGPRRKTALLRRFGSVQRIREASIDELVAAAGVSVGQAKKIKEHL
jgi:excinuclease ABC subunit C